MRDVQRALNVDGHYRPPAHARRRRTGRTRAPTNVTKPTTSSRVIDELFKIRSRYFINYVSARNTFHLFIILVINLIQSFSQSVVYKYQSMFFAQYFDNVKGKKIRSIVISVLKTPTSFQSFSNATIQQVYKKVLPY